MITSANQLVYSVSAARRIFAIPKGVRVRIVKFWRVVWMWVAGHRPRFVSLSLFKAHFAERRMRAAQALSAHQWADVPHWWTVRNPANNNSYPVVLAPAGPVCRCDDDRNQRHLLGKGICKHGYAVLQAMGYGSLSAYLAR